MARQRQLKDEAYVNDFVIHQNACEDRKLQHQLNQLERIQNTQRRRLEHAQHYFTVLHKVVPSFNTISETPTTSRPSRTNQSRPVLRKRFTEPVMPSRFQTDDRKAKGEPLFGNRLTEQSADWLRGSTSHQGHEKLDVEIRTPNMRGLRHNIPSDEAHLRQSLNAANAKTPSLRQAWASAENEAFFVEGKHTRFGEKTLQRPKMSEGVSRSNENQTTEHRLGSMKCANYVAQNHKYLTKKEGDSNWMIDGNTEVASVESKGKVSPVSSETNRGIEVVVQSKAEHDASTISPVSDISIIDVSSDTDSYSKLPRIQPDQQNIGLRVSGSNRPSHEMKVLYQIRNGHIDVRQSQTPVSFHSEFERGGERMTVDKLSGNFPRRLRKSKSLEHHCKGMGLGTDRPDTPMVTGAQMTLVKFLPKSKQAFYLKYEDKLSANLASSWHGSGSSHF